MVVSVTHAKVNNIADWTQAELDAQIAAGNYPAGTTLADITLPSDWNDGHTITGLATVASTGSYNDLSDKPSLSSYVPYTGASSDVDLGNNSLNAKSLNVTGTAGNGHIHLKHQSADASATGSSTVLFANSSGDIKYKNDGGFYTTFVTSANTADRTYTFPDSSGAVAVNLGNVTNDTQTKASIVPNTAPSAGQILVGNAGGTAYAPVSLSGSGATFSLSSAGVLTVSGIANASLTNSAITIAGTSTALGGSITQDTITGLSSTGLVKRTGANTLAVAVAGTDYQAADATLTALAAYNTNGILTQTAADTFAGRTITGTANQVTVTNGDGVAGNPTLSLPATINVNTSGSAATLTTPRAIYGNNFDGSAALTQVIASTYGGTGNGFTKFSGAATTEKTYTLPNATCNILTDNALVTVAQGGTGRNTSTTAYGLIAAGTTATGAHQTLAAGATTEILVGGGAAALPVWTTASGTGAPLRQGTPTITTPVINGTITGTGQATAATASTITMRDSSANITVNNTLGGYTTTATAAGTTVLTVGSTRCQYFTGSTTQTVTLPVTSTLTLNHSFYIVNNSTGLVTVNSSGGNNVIILGAGTAAEVTCILTSGTTAASWNADYSGARVATGKKLTVNNTITMSGTDSTTMTFPSTSATIARTDAAQTFTGTQTFSSALNLTSGQITFPAAQSASADANTLDDYEEGTWTPAIAFGGAAVGVTYTAQTGYYLKVGSMVTAWARIDLSNKGSSTGSMTITGFPFTNNLGNFICSVLVDAFTSYTGYVTRLLFQSGGTSALVRREINGANSSVDQSMIQNTSTLNFVIQYRS